MKIIISPAKKMNQTDTLEWKAFPIYLTRAEKLLSYMKGLPLSEAKKIWKCNDTLAQLNYQRFQTMDLRKNLSPAILSYEGIQYQYMAPEVMEEKALFWLEDHLRILSGFYGILKPMDGICPYRLEMQAKISLDGCRDLYDFWGDRLIRELTKEDPVILNLASKEYAKSIESHLQKDHQWINCVFAQEKEGKLIQKGTLAKMARGEMVRFLANERIEDPRGAKDFQGLGFRYSEEHSNEKEYVFLLN